ncbi:hypothetical protein HRbin30_02014 [bacterium HR30]|nr:hypothetical protein HRbin30_02014 [bacterium HR30]
MDLHLQVHVIVTAARYRFHLEIHDKSPIRCRAHCTVANRTTHRLHVVPIGCEKWVGMFTCRKALVGRVCGTRGVATKLDPAIGRYCQCAVTGAFDRDGKRHGNGGGHVVTTEGGKTRNVVGAVSVESSQGDQASSSCIHRPTFVVPVIVENLSVACQRVGGRACTASSLETDGRALSVGEVAGITVLHCDKVRRLVELNLEANVVRVVPFVGWVDIDLVVDQKRAVWALPHGAIPDVRSKCLQVIPIRSQEWVRVLRSRKTSVCGVGVASPTATRASVSAEFDPTVGRDGNGIVGRPFDDKVERKGNAGNGIVPTESEEARNVGCVDVIRTVGNSRPDRVIGPGGSRQCKPGQCKQRPEATPTQKGWP